MDQSTHRSKVVTDVKRNRLTLQLVGRLSKGELDDIYSDIRQAIADLKPGFDVISDFSRCQLVYLGGLSTFRRIVHFLVTNGVAEVIQVIQKERLISKQIVQHTVQMRGYKPVFATGTEDAENRLANLVKRNGVRFYFDHLTLDYEIEGASGKGRIDNISTSGIAVAEATLGGIEEDELLIRFSLRENDEGAVDFSIAATIVRADAFGFAAQYHDLAEEQKTLLWNCLVYESRQGGH